ncbi:MAG: hypothetical protein AAB604_01500 [Patescibacteria group bacterium]
MSRARYYFKKPKSAIAQDILIWIGIVGIVAIAATSPFFIVNVLKAFKKGSQYHRKDIFNAFYRLRKSGDLIMRTIDNQLYIELTEKGRKKASWLQVNHLAIKKQKKWNGKWWMVIFDIQERHRTKREALRGFFKRLGFLQLQKSVWIQPYDCRDEINLLREFFGLEERELKLIVADDIGDDSFVREHFNP